MSNESKRITGAAEELGGKVKGAVGKLIGNEQMQVEGKIAEVKGEVSQHAAKLGERLKGKVEEVAGAVKKHVGAALDNEQMEAEGKLKEMKGEARQHLNK